jgi:hypothetical protein
MKEFLSTAFIISAATLLVVSLLEVFLDDVQKARINTLVVRFWNVLDGLKARRLLDLLEARQRWLVGTGVLLAAAFVLWAEIRIQRTEPLSVTDIIIACIIFGPGILFGLKIANWILRAITLFWAVVRATISIVITFLPLPLLAGIETVFVLPILPSIATQNPTLGIALLQLLIILATLTSTFFTAIAFMFWCPVAIPLVVINVASALIFVAEPVVRKIAEYPKGVLAAVIVILLL